ncbi:calcium-binding protein [Mesobacterium pallidum]|uniref:calcium-binding protein n=1 Tax=Mesobacterium pallidum TaxID=2872037 RepID=UPI001EE174AC|nr:calcium-binding protein [Mesobacterium pallidum]
MAHLAASYTSFDTFLGRAEGFWSVDLTALNNSGVSGTAILALSTEDDGTQYLNVAVSAEGLTANQVHAQHIHGTFDEDGNVTNATTPTLADDADRDGMVEVFEGLPKYGDILLSLDSAAGAMPTANADGTVSFVQSYNLSDLTNFLSPVSGVQYTADDLMPLIAREIVLHGVDVPDGIGEGTDGEVDGGTNGYTGILPAAAGEIEASSYAEAVALLGAHAELAAEFVQLDGGANVFAGGLGDDTIYGFAGNDELMGDADGDVIYSGSGDDMAWGGADNDTVYGGSGNDTLDGGDGDDRAWGGAGADALWGGNGNDEIRGMTGNDYAEGDAGDDVILAGAGEDTVWGGEGDDVIVGGTGSDELHGGSGKDAIYGGAEADVIYGNDGDDTITGGSEDDFIWGGDGADRFAHDGTSWMGTETLLDFDTGEGDMLWFTGAGAAAADFSVMVSDMGVGDAGTDDAAVMYDGNTLFVIADGAAWSSLNIGIDGNTFDLLA